MDPPRKRAEALIAAAAEAQARATAKALSGRRTVKRLLAMMKAAMARIEKLVAPGSTPWRRRPGPSPAAPVAPSAATSA